MKKVVIEKDFLDIFPQAEVAIIVAKGIKNHVKDEAKLVNLLQEGIKNSSRFTPLDEFSENTVVKLWREAYQQFKTKKGARSSIEALLKRAKNGGGPSNINPLVDIYNYVSLSHGFPCGAEDIDAIKGDMRLTLADGTESFLTLGSEKVEPPYPGEVVYKDEAGAICRCFNWRESIRTMITDKTSNAVIVLENIDPNRRAEFATAIIDLEVHLKDLLGGDISSEVLNIVNTETNMES